MMLEMYPDGHSRAEAAKVILQQFMLDSQYSLSNPIMVDNLLHLARIIHDTIK